MFAQFQSFIVIGLIIALLALGGSFAFYRNSVKTEIAELTQQNVAITLAVKEQSRTIEQMVKDAERITKTNKELATSIMKSEMEFVDEWAAINALDLSSNGAVNDASELERKVNEEFEKSIAGLRAATGVVRDKAANTD